MSFTKNCPACGKEFETPRRTQIYCSSTCANKGRGKNFHPAESVEKRCPICLTSFVCEPSVRYCSTECENEAIRRKRASERAKQHRGPSLSQVAKMASDAGMSYGKYVALHQI